MARTSCGPLGEGVENTSPTGNGHHSEETPGRGRSRETGVFGGWLALAGGPQCRVSRATGRPGAARPDKAPSISYVEGALFHSARPGRFCQDRHARIRPDAIRV